MYLAPASSPSGSKDLAEWLSIPVPTSPERPKVITHRYELYCASKAAKTTQCTVHCDLSVQDCEEWNRSRQEEGRWEDEVLAALAMR